MSRKELPRPGLVAAAVAGQITNRQGGRSAAQDTTTGPAAEAAASHRRGGGAAPRGPWTRVAPAPVPHRRRPGAGAGLPAVHRRRPPQHRSRRPREGAAGQLVQIDGSPHDGLEGRGPRTTCHHGGLARGPVWRDGVNPTHLGRVVRELTSMVSIPTVPASPRHSLKADRSRVKQQRTDHLSSTGWAVTTNEYRPAAAPSIARWAVQRPGYGRSIHIGAT